MEGIVGQSSARALVGAVKGCRQLGAHFRRCLVSGGDDIVLLLQFGLGRAQPPRAVAAPMATPWVPRGYRVATAWVPRGYRVGTPRVPREYSVSTR